MHHLWTWRQQHKDADCGLQVSGGGGGESQGPLKKNLQGFYRY